MLQTIAERLRQQYRTVPYPSVHPVLPERFMGRPHINAHTCTASTGCTACMDVCPAQVITLQEGTLGLDMGRCTFCGKCAAACPQNALTFTKEYRLASSTRQGLWVFPSPEPADTPVPSQVQPFDHPLLPSLRRSCRLREVSAAGCNACEADCNVLGTIVFDLPRFGIDYVASPRHADGLLITGPLPRNMQLATQKCYTAVTPPKLVMAVGACAISGGLFSGLEAEGEGAPAHLAVNLFIPGCPPHPYTILDGMLRFLGKQVP